MAPCSCSRPGSIPSRARSRSRFRRTDSSSSPERIIAGMAPTAKISDQALIALFLDMLAAERGAAKNTLAAYARDLADFSLHLGATGCTIVRRSEEHTS